jgi:hypothetical protein
MAIEGGIKSVYDQLYGFLSMLAHGTATHLLTQSQLERQPPIHEIISLARGCFKSIHLIVLNRVREGGQTPRSALEEILKVKLSA